MKDFNKLIVLEAVRCHAPITRTEIAQRTGLISPTVSNLVNTLIKEGLVIEIGRRPQKRGQPPIELGINQEATYTVGLYLDRDVLRGVIADLKGTIINQVTLAVDPSSPSNILNRSTEAYAKLVNSAPTEPEKIAGVGVVTAGPLDLVRGYLIRPNMPQWYRVPFRQRLADALGATVYLDNNVTAAAVGEYWYGAGRPYQNFLYVHIGYGIGGGLFLNGRVYRGTGFNAGEFGHILVESGGFACDCGSRGCLETRASLLALRRDLGQVYSEPSQLADKLARRDVRLIAWLDQAARFLAIAVTSVDNLLDLEAVIIGGRLSTEVVTYLIESVNEHRKLLGMRGRPHEAKIERGQIGADPSTLGAAMLPIYDAFVPDPSTKLLEQATPFIGANSEDS